MALVNLKCSNCGARLRKDVYSNRYVCDYCGAFALDIESHKEGAEAESAHSQLQKAQAFFKFGDLGSAFNIYRKCQQENPENAESWTAYIYFIFEQIKASGIVSIDGFEGSVKRYTCIKEAYDRAKILLHGAPELEQLVDDWGKTWGAIVQKLITGEYRFSDNTVTDFDNTPGAIKPISANSVICFRKYVCWPGSEFSSFNYLHCCIPDELIPVIQLGIANAKKLSDANIHYGYATDSTSKLGWWKNYGGCATDFVLGRSLYFTRSDYDGGQTCRVDFDHQLQVTDTMIKTAAIEAELNASSLDQCPYCHSHKIGKTFLGGKIHCKSCKKIL